MNLNPELHYIFLSKCIFYIKRYLNIFFAFIPLKPYLQKRYKENIACLTKDVLCLRLRQCLGDFEDFSKKCANDSEYKTIIKEADAALNHQFNVLGSGYITMNPINWHSDFKSGYIWHKGKFYTKYRRKGYGKHNPDIKVPWELSRSHQLLWLGEAFLITRDEKYAKEIFDEVSCWIDDNPLMHSINWTCAMDVSIRAVNWMYAINMVSSSKLMSEEFSRKFVVSLFSHLFFIEHNLEKWFPYSNNHYFSDLVGLIFLSKLLNKSNTYGFAKSELYNEIRCQFLPSGIHFEKSISYHRLMTELATYSLLLIDRCGEIVPLDIQYRLGLMFNFVANYLKPNGKAPLFSDNDDGRLLPFVRYNFLDHRYLLCLANEIFGDVYDKDDIGKTDAFFAHKVPNRYFVSCIPDFPRFNSIFYGDAGLAIMKNDVFYTMVANSPLGPFLDDCLEKSGSHSHSDLLSIEINVKGIDFIVDSGSGVYTSSIDTHKKFRSTMHHNTICVDGLNQQGVSERSFFVYDYASKIVSFYANYCNPESKYVVGSYRYDYNNISFVHKRSVNLLCNNVLIADCIDIKGKHNYRCMFHISPGLFVEKSKDFDVVLSKPDLNFSLGISFSFVGPYNVEIVDDLYSPSYGVFLDSKVVICEFSAIGEVIFNTQLSYISKNE